MNYEISGGTAARNGDDYYYKDDVAGEVGILYIVIGIIDVRIRN